MEHHLLPNKKSRKLMNFRTKSSFSDRAEQTLSEYILVEF